MATVMPARGLQTHWKKMRERIEVSMINNEEQRILCIKLASIQKEEEACVNAMLNSKAYKIAYLLNRLDKEFVRGSKESRREFINWLTKRKKGRDISDLHYVLRLKKALGEMRHEMSSAFSQYEDVSHSSGEQLKKEMREITLKKIHNIVSGYAGNKIVVFPDVVDWNIPLFQRPQQLAMAFAQEGYLFFYVTPNFQDGIKDLAKVQENCYLITKEFLMDVLDIAKAAGKETIMEIYSTDNFHTLSEINQWKQHCGAILYEYIDEISDEITGKVPELTIERHKAFLEDESVYVVATADKLYDEVVAVRGSNKRCLNSGNGVDCEHFTVEKSMDMIPEKLKPIIEKNKPIIGYFGAIANWFDFELIAYAARQRPDYEFMMIGPHYGDHDLPILNEIKNIPNLHFVGTVEYKILPYVANYFTVATIPFKINEITESTSPIKLFEYMAMGKPCVTTAMRECFKYPVVKVAKGQEEYVACLDRAVEEAADDKCIEQLKCVAQKNSWREKAKEILRLVSE